jgi:hypothetical protein
VRAQRPVTDAAGLSALGETDPTIRREIDAARTRGLPVEPLLNKVREGRLKRASAPRIRTAVAALAVRLDSARSIFGPDATLEELTAGADALAAGAGAAELRAVTSAVTTRPLTAPIGALAQLVASGVAPRHAAEMIVDLLRRKVGGAVVLAFGNLVESDAASGVPPEEAAAFRLHSLATGGITALNATSSSGGVTSAMQRPTPGNTTPRRRP